MVTLWDMGWRERFEVIFDEHLIFGRVKDWYPVLREITHLREPDAYAIMPLDPMFRTDDEFLPLQACDMFAWCLRIGGSIAGPEEHPFDWLLPELSAVKRSAYSQNYDRERMESVIAFSETELSKILGGAYSSPEALAKYAKLIRLYRERG